MGNRTAPPVIQGFVFPRYLNKEEVHQWDQNWERHVYWGLYNINGKAYQLNRLLPT